jgi:hypothetical protein
MPTLDPVRSIILQSTSPCRSTPSQQIVYSARVSANADRWGVECAGKISFK